jgi:hypothetical protein
MSTMQRERHIARFTRRRTNPMFKRRLLDAIATAALLTGLIAPGHVRAQGTLGFTIDPTQGLPGTVVNGQVNVADVQALCTTDLTDLEARFNALLEGPYAGGQPTGELFSRIFPGQSDFVFENCAQAAYSLTGITVLGISLNIQGAAETALPLTFVMTFVDPSTLQPLGELGHFDPATGVGSVVVPNLAPGPWPVAATCVGPTFDIDMLEAGIRANGAFLESLGFPTCDINSQAFADYVVQLLGPDADLFTFLNAFGPTFIQNIVVPDALGVQFFTVLASPSDLVNQLIASLQALAQAGQVKAGPAKGLGQLLTNVLRSIDGGDTDAACDQLNGFEHAAQGAFRGAPIESLLAQVDAIQAALGCGGAGSPSGAFVE